MRGHRTGSFRSAASRTGHRGQLGMSSITLLALIVVVAFLGLCAFKVTSLYYENIMLQTTLEGIDKPVGVINDMSNAEIRDAMGKSFRVNAITVDPREFSITRDNNETTLVYDYEAKTELIYNSSVVAAFQVRYSTAGE